MPDKIHLHWLWHMGPKAVLGLTKGISLCSQKDLPPSQIAVDLEVATCERCKQIATQIKEETPPPPMAIIGAQKPKAVVNIPDGEAIIRMKVKHNVRKPGSGAAERFRVLLDHDGKKVQEFISAGGNPETLKNAIKDGNAEVE
jgi:hypothetical protein